MYIIADDIVDDLQGFVCWSQFYGWHFTTNAAEATRFDTTSEAKAIIADHYADVAQWGVRLHPVYIEG